MLFNSFDFLIFFPFVTTLYFLFPHKYRWFLLLIVSCIFYMVFIPAYILVLFVTIIIDYAAGIMIEKTHGKKKRVFLIMSIISTCLVLFIFKYFNFFNANLKTIAQFLHWNYPMRTLNLVLPIGLSFHTFQSLSYVIEVYKGTQKAERNFGIYALYVMFYPQLVAGPIERPYNLLPQFYQKHYFEYQRVVEGLRLMLWGMFKKVVIADRLAFFVNRVYDNPVGFMGISLIMATVFFAFQIYCDFSGYSDIAIGSARVMGFNLMNNFNHPYSAQSIVEFWRRWHISLSTWFRDYVYIPLGGNRVYKMRWCFNVFVTLLLSGLWHGASWTFLIWGILNGLYLIFGNITKTLRSRMVDLLRISRFTSFHRWLRIGATFTLVCFGWIFFRAKNLDDASYIITHLFSGIPTFFSNFIININALNTGKGLLKPLYLGRPQEFIIVLSVVTFLELMQLWQRQRESKYLLLPRLIWTRWVVYYIFIIIIVFSGNFTKQQFIYFQF